MTKDRPIFLVGCPRSGTTLLSVMLHAHPRIAMPPETRFLQDAFRERAKFGDLTKPENRRALALRITGRGTRFRDLGLNRSEVVERIVAGPPTFGSAAGTVWREFARSRGKARWGEKRPSYWRDTTMIQQLFPDAQFVHLVRDGRACVASLKAVKWWTSGATGAMVSWAMADYELRRVARQLPADTYYRLRYEDLLADPRRELGALCAFLGEDFDEAMLNFSGAAADIVPKRKTWHERTRGQLDPDRIEAWRTDLEPAEIGLFELVARARLRANGYQLSDAGTRPSPVAIAEYYAIWARRLAQLRVEHVNDARLQRRYPQPVQDRG